MKLDVRCSICSARLKAEIGHWDPIDEIVEFKVDPCESCLNEIEETPHKVANGNDRSEADPKGFAEDLRALEKDPNHVFDDADDTPPLYDPDEHEETFTAGDDIGQQSLFQDEVVPGKGDAYEGPDEPDGRMDDDAIRNRLKIVEEHASVNDWEAGFIESLTIKYPKGGLSENQRNSAARIIKKYDKYIP